MKNRRLLKVLLVLLAVVVAGVVFSCSANTQPAADEEQAVIKDETADDADDTDETSSSEEAETESESQTTGAICVHVCGSVATPGVYYLNEGARVHEAVEMAGGLTENAASEYINLAGIITDGEQIYIPDKGEIEAGTYESKSIQSTDDGLVNINTASEEELMTLPGVGQTKAKAIIEYRDSSGGFAAKEDIMNVSGIAESSYEKIKDYIKV